MRFIELPSNVIQHTIALAKLPLRLRTVCKLLSTLMHDAEGYAVILRKMNCKPTTRSDDSLIRLLNNLPNTSFVVPDKRTANVLRTIKSAVRIARRPHGKGEEKYNEGSSYVGEFQNGKRHGYGKYTFPNGATYEGWWRDSQRHGQGKQIQVSGASYEGGWENGKEHGQGKCIALDSTHTGGYQNGTANGKGKNIGAAGDSYEGDFKDGKAHGKGKYIGANNSNSYEGEWENGKEHGQGRYIDDRGNLFEGEWRNGVLW